MGLLAWRGEPLRGRAGLAKGFLLGAALAAAIWSKQTGVLLIAGLLCLRPKEIFTDGPDDGLNVLACFLALPLVVVGLVLLERQGLGPFYYGLSSFGQYRSYPDWPAHFWFAYRQAPFFTVAALSAAAACAALSLRRAARCDSPNRRIAVFCAFAASASSLQFFKRPYLHYALIPMPFFIIALLAFPEEIAGTGRMRRYAGFAWLVLAGLCLSGNPQKRWTPLRWPARYVLRREEVLALRPLIAPNEKVLVVPPRHNEIHFILDTRPGSDPRGYLWPPLPSSVLKELNFDAVVVLKRLDLSDQEACRELDCEAMLAAVKKIGFRPVAERGGLSIWRKTPPAGRFHLRGDALLKPRGVGNARRRGELFAEE